jgi:uncharacterized protein (DUF924 family)
MRSGIPLKTEGGEPVWVGNVFRFWFEEVTNDRWFSRSDELDTRIRERFLTLHEQLVAQDGPDVTAPRLLLAAVIVLDQFSRNMFRGAPRAFAADSIARRLARSAVEQGLDAAMSKEERLFLYLPFQHSEDREDQALSLRLYEQLGDGEWTRYALAHKVIIDRFGRFPHRNAALNRSSTEAELAFLKEPMSSF